jgi:hypothetical protein
MVEMQLEPRGQVKMRLSVCCATRSLPLPVLYFVASVSAQPCAASHSEPCVVCNYRGKTAARVIIPAILISVYRKQATGLLRDAIVMVSHQQAGRLLYIERISDTRNNWLLLNK